MRHPLYSELRTVYETTARNPHTFRVTIKMKDMVDGDILEYAVRKTAKRYPYFCVKVEIDENEVFFADNPAPLPVLHTDGPVTLGGEETDGHILAVCRWKNKIHIDAWHALTDGGGIYHFIKTLLYYYCSEYYKLDLSTQNVRLAGDPIDPAEWEDPAAKPVESTPFAPVEKWSSPGFQLKDGGRIALSDQCIVYNIRIPEKEFMRFNFSNDGSPGTVIALFLARAIRRVTPIKKDPIVIAMCVNQRRMLSAPLAHQSLVGDVRLVYDEKVDALPFSAQATSFRGKVILQSDPDIVLEEIKEYQQIVRELRALPDHAARRRYAVDRMDRMTSCFTATVSYVGKTDMGEAERFIQEFHVLPSTALPSSATPLTLELSAMNGSFYVNFMQYFENDCYLNAFIRELRENEIDYDVLYQEKTKYPGMVDLWGEE